MKTFLVVGGLFMIIFTSIFPLRRGIKEYQVQKHGKIITATITSIPNCTGTKGRYFMNFTYEGKEFDKSVGCGFADTHKVGENIKLKHIAGSTIFLFENEKIEKEFISSSILAAFGIIFIMVGLRNN